MFQTRFLRFFVMALFVIVACSSAASAQRGGGGGGGRGGGGFGFGGPGGGFGGAAGPASIATRDEVKAELKLSDDQVSKLETISEDSVAAIRDSSRDLFGSLRDASPEERQEMMQKIASERLKQQKEERTKVLDVLSSDQRGRFGEIEFQFYLSRGQLESALAAASVELSDSEKKDLEASQSEINEKVQARMAEIRLELQKEVLGKVMNPGKLDELLGKPFEFSSDRGGRGGGRGGRGGNAGGGGPGRQNRRPDAGSAPDSGNSDPGATTGRNRRRDN